MKRRDRAKGSDRTQQPNAATGPHRVSGATRSLGSRTPRWGPGCGQLVTVMLAMSWAPWAETKVTVVVAGAVVGLGPVPT